MYEFAMQRYVVDGTQEQLTLPSAEEVRPVCCARCGALAVSGERVRLEGNGVRWRPVVVPSEEGGLRVVKSWVRRYRCLECGGAPSVQPTGIVPGHVYSLAAMLHTWLLIASKPVGHGQTEREVCALKGADRPPGRRWRSPRRWQHQNQRWWPSRVQTGPEGLIVQFIVEAGGTDIARLVRRTVSSHALWGAAV